MNLEHGAFLLDASARTNANAPTLRPVERSAQRGEVGRLHSPPMGLLTFGLNVTLDGCIDHTQGIVDDELHDFWTQLMDESGAMLFGRTTYELMESAWPSIARDASAPRAMHDWAQKLEAKPKYVVSSTRRDFPWQNTIVVQGELREAITALKAKTERGVLVGSPKLATALEEMGLVDEYRIVVHPVLSGRGPTLFHGLASRRELELSSTRRFASGALALHLRRRVSR
jgi:dihydrofolate reductase